MLFSVVFYLVQNPWLGFSGMGWLSFVIFFHFFYCGHFSSIFWVDRSCRRRSSTLGPGLWCVQALVIFYSSALKDWLFEICPWMVSRVPSFPLWWSNHRQYLVGKQTLEMVKDYQDIQPLVQLVFLIGQCRQQIILGKVCHHRVWLFLVVLLPVAPLRNYHVLILHNHHWSLRPGLLSPTRSKVSIHFSVQAS